MSRYALVLLMVGLLLGEASVAEEYFLACDGSPACETYSAALKAGKSRAAAETDTKQRESALHTMQEKVIEQASNSGINFHVRGSLTNLLNGILVECTTSQAKQLEYFPGIAGMRELPLGEFLMQDVGSILELGEAWMGLPSEGEGEGEGEVYTGEGMTIAVIDSGVDYLHRDLGGSGDPAHYASNDVRTMSDFPYTDKVIDGYDYFGDPAYPNAPWPYEPDPDPWDATGHGTKVASIAAGTGLTHEYEAYSGPYNLTMPLNMRLFPGIAPRAKIVALRAGGKIGDLQAVLQSAVLQSLEWCAQRPGLVDVVNLSYGIKRGPTDSDVCIAINNLVEHYQISVVAGAGNDFDEAFVVAAPASAEAAIAAAGAVRADSAEHKMQDLSSRGPALSISHVPLLKPDLTAPSANIECANTNNQIASSVSGTSFSSPIIAGAVALLRQKYPQLNVQQVKSLLLNTADADMVVENEAGSYGCSYEFGATQQADRLGGEYLAEPQRCGAGYLNIHKALSTPPLLVYDKDAPYAVSITFETVEFMGSVEEERVILLHNLSLSTLGCAITIRPIASNQGAVLELSTTSVTVPPSGFGSVTLRMSLTAEDVTVTSHPGRETSLSPVYGGTYELYPLVQQTSISGYIDVITDTGDCYVLPYYAWLEPAAEMRAAQHTISLDEPQGVLPLEGSSFASGGVFDLQTLDETPLVAPLLVLGFDRIASSVPHAHDLMAVAVGTNHREGGVISDDELFVGIATSGTFLAPTGFTLQHYVVVLDVDNDWIPDFTLWNGPKIRGDDYASLLTNPSLLTLAGPCYPLNVLNPFEHAPKLLRDNFLLHTVNLGSLGMNSEQSRINLQVRIGFPDLDPKYSGYTVDEMPDSEDGQWYTYDVSAGGLVPSLGVFGSPFLWDNSESPISWTYDAVSFQTNGIVQPGTEEIIPPAALLLYHDHNRVNQRLEFVWFESSDIDQDGVPDYEEGMLDTDGDGLLDFYDADADGDAVDDILEGGTDSDGDGLANSRDFDSDNDTIPDGVEGFSPGFPEELSDTDEDGVPDMLDDDSDGDGIYDIDETAIDEDVDGVGNFRDLDSNGDGIHDNQN